MGVRVTDDAGGIGTDTAVVTVANLPPTADAGGPYFGNEGSNIVLDGSGSTDPAADIVSYDWDFDGDGQFDDASGAVVAFNSTDDGVFTASLRVTDDAGAVSIDAASVTVANVVPTADAGGPYAGIVGENVTLDAGGSSDPGNDIASYEWDLDGDGQYDDATGASTVFTSATPGDYSVAVRVTDDDGASSTNSTVVQITEVPSEVVVFEDSFENGQWNGLWVEDSQNDWFTSTQRATGGSFSAEVDGRATNATLTMSTPIDLSGYASAELTFDWLIESGFDSGEYLALDVFNGSSWVNDVRRLNGNSDAENTWHQETVDLSPYMSAGTLIRFRALVSRSNEDANVDNVRIVASGFAAAPVALATALGSEGAISWSLSESAASNAAAPAPAARQQAFESFNPQPNHAPLRRLPWHDDSERRTADREFGRREVEEPAADEAAFDLALESALAGVN